MWTMSAGHARGYLLAHEQTRVYVCVCLCVCVCVCYQVIRMSNIDLALYDNYACISLSIDVLIYIYIFSNSVNNKRRTSIIS